MDVEQTWKTVAQSLQLSTEVSARCWEEIEQQYTEKSRYYHNIAHLCSMFQSFEAHRAQIDQVETLCLSIFYHDIVYNATKQNNELKSAEWMEKRMRAAGVSEAIIRDCYRQILLTKTHDCDPNQAMDDAYLLDFDLEVLSRKWEAYASYCDQIRQEYSMYPNFLYKRGRKAVLHHFLDKESIYLTAYFRRHHESQARDNLRRELDLL